jgi:FSR family fosmidomycin resistance protein-like MFS transporter
MPIEHASPSAAQSTSHPRRARTLAVAGFAHALHDGYTDLIYLLLPVWQAEFGLGYGLLALMRGLYAGLMAALQMPAGRLAERLGGRAVLAAGCSSASRPHASALTQSLARSSSPRSFQGTTR